MRWFRQKEQQQEEPKVAYWRAQCVALSAELSRRSEIAERFALTNLELSREIVRLTRRSAPELPDGEVEQPKSTRENDVEKAVTLESPERSIRPEAGPQRVE